MKDPPPLNPLFYPDMYCWIKTEEDIQIATLLDAVNTQDRNY